MLAGGTSLLFTDKSIFEKRLVSDHLSESTLLYLLGETPDMLTERLERRAWLVDLERAFAEYDYRVHEDSDSRSQSNEYFRLKDADGYLVGMAPIINAGVKRILAGVKVLQQSGSYLPFDPEQVVSLFLTSLLTKLISQSNRALVLELNIARLEEKLEGETPEQRFTYFRNLLKDPDFLLLILLDYPVLTRQAVVTTNYWARNSLDCLERLTRDWKEIVSTLSPMSDPGLLVEVKSEAGDTHRQGRSVKILKFANDFQLVYKPHSLSVALPSTFAGCAF